MRYVLAFVLITLSGLVQADQSPFPYPVVEVTGVDALDEWKRLAQGDGTPVILGDLREYELYVEMFDPQWTDQFPDTPQDILRKAAALRFPDALYDLRRAEQADMLTWMREQGYEEDANEIAKYDASVVPPDLMGPIPNDYWPAIGPFGYIDYSTNLPAETVFIAILPTDNPWEAPAYLKWGGWNANPPAEIHVAALRDWHDRYGAVPLVMTGAVLELYVPNRPTNEDEAIALASEQFIYCEDLIYQGLDHVGMLAADRMRTPIWYFWWD